MLAISTFVPTPSVWVAKRILREGDGHDPLEAGAPRGQQAPDARDELGGLAGAGGGLDEEGGVEVLADSPSSFRVARRRAATRLRPAHASSRSAARGTSSPEGLREVRSSS